MARHVIYEGKLTPRGELNYKFILYDERDKNFAVWHSPYIHAPLRAKSLYKMPSFNKGSIFKLAEIFGFDVEELKRKREETIVLKDLEIAIVYDSKKKGWELWVYYDKGKYVVITGKKRIENFLKIYDWNVDLEELKKKYLTTGSCSLF